MSRLLLTLVLWALCLSSSAFAQDDKAMKTPTYTFSATAPPWLPGLEMEVGSGTDFGDIPCVRVSSSDPCTLSPSTTLSWGGLTWFVQGFGSHDDSDCVYYGQEIVVLVADLPSGGEPEVLTVIQMHRRVECDWNHTYTWQQAIADLDGDGVTELCVESLRERVGTHPEDPNWAHAQQRRVLAFGIDSAGEVTAKPGLAELCPDVGYAPFVDDTDPWP